NVVREKANNFREQFASQEPSQILDWLKYYFKTQVANILQTSQAQVEVEKSLNLMGFDSLMFMELRNRIQNDLGIDIGVADLMGGITISKLASKVSELASQINSDLEQKEGTIGIESQETTTIEGTL
ncbi:MAG: acyl carrier protein, partial [Moorea sp. SIO3C2]|nr:acyl carrier protein [Moorena sp. SIO3C2]